MAARILVVDDSPTIRMVVSTILERSGYEPKVASDGQDAYDALASGEVKADLVLVDFVMPRMNGYQFCRALRDNAELAMTPVVLMSAKGDRIRDQFVQQTGAIDAITKPFDAQALVAVIQNTLRKVNTARASSARLPDFDGDDVTGVTPADTPGVIEYETKRTHVAQIVAQKLASIAARALAERPEDLASPNLAATLAERLSNEAILEMMEAISERRDKKGALLSGDLGVVPIGAILQLLQAENQTGVLVCKNGNAEVRATFRGGAIDLVEASGAGDEFRLGRFFVEEGILTPEEIDAITQRASLVPVTARIVFDAERAEAVGEVAEPTASDAVLESPRISVKESDDVEAPRSSIQMRETQVPDTLPWGRRPSAIPPSEPERREDLHAMVTLPGAAVMDALAAATQKPRPLGMALLAAGKIVESQLRSALTQQSNELLYEVLRWPSGRFELRREPPSELAENARLGLPVASVVMEGFRRVDEWRLLERTLGSFDAVLLRDDAAFGKLDVGSLPLRERAVLDAVDGERTVRAIVRASNLSSFDACRILVQFLEARALRRRAG
ncbi:MAG: response regulator [Labilithrix sp.]|nr:response regulator [Labilithrix sp.]